MKRILLALLLIATPSFADDTDISIEQILNRVWDGSNALRTSGGTASFDPAVIGDDTILLDAASGVFIISADNGTNNENLRTNLETTSNTALITSTSGVDEIDYFSNAVSISAATSSTTLGVVASASDTGTIQGVSVSRTNSNTGASAGSIGVGSTATISGNSSTPFVIAVNGIGVKSGATGGSTGTLRGVRGIAQYSSTGTQTDAFGVYGDCQKTVSGSGVITDCYSIYGDTPDASGGGTITNSYAGGFAGNVRVIGGNISGDGAITSSRTTDIGWNVVAGADTACNTTCTNACVFGVNTASLTADIVGCSDATADECLCAGAS